MNSTTPSKPKVRKTEAQAEPSPEQFYLTGQRGTERAFTGPCWNEKPAGLYSCICCGAALASSETNHDSGTGWPSFWGPLLPSALSEHHDRSWLMRTEIRRESCDGHLGHVSATVHNRPACAIA